MFKLIHSAYIALMGPATLEKPNEPMPPRYTKTRDTWVGLEAYDAYAGRWVSSGDVLDKNDLYGLPHVENEFLDRKALKKAQEAGEAV